MSCDQVTSKFDTTRQREYKNLHVLFCIFRINHNIWSPPFSVLLTHCAPLQNLPESNPMRMEETRKRNIMVLQALKDAAETDENIARTMGQRSK